MLTEACTPLGHRATGQPVHDVTAYHGRHREYLRNSRGLAEANRVFAVSGVEGQKWPGQMMDWRERCSSRLAWRPVSDGTNPGYAMICRQVSKGDDRLGDATRQHSTGPQPCPRMSGISWNRLHSMVPPSGSIGRPQRITFSVWLWWSRAVAHVTRVSFVPSPPDVYACTRGEAIWCRRVSLT